jgi:hypothetical protein
MGTSVHGHKKMQGNDISKRWRVVLLEAEPRLEFDDPA